VTSAEAQQILYLALAEPIGLLLATSDSAKAKTRLYSERAKLKDPALAVLQFRTSPIDGGNLVVTKEKVTRPIPESLEELGL
jgi:hypothetical protein